MDISTLRFAILGVEAKISELTNTRASMLLTLEDLESRKPVGRPKGSTNGKSETKPQAPTKVRPPLSPAARKRIADAQKKRWAKIRKQQKQAQDTGSGPGPEALV